MVEGLDWGLILPLAVGVGLLLAGHLNQRLKPLLVGIALAYLSFPIYYAISQLPLSPYARIMLQVAAFAVITGYVFYTLAKHMERLRGERRAQS